MMKNREVDALLELAAANVVPQQTTGDQMIYHVGKAIVLALLELTAIIRAAGGVR